MIFKLIVLWKTVASSDFYLFKKWGYKIMKRIQACCKNCH